jgi:hypothetical protein
VPDTDPALGFPEPFTIRGFDGSLSDYMDSLYREYRTMLDQADIRPWGKPLAVWGNLAGDGRDAMFWHLVTTGSKTHAEADRRLDLMRCARLNLVRSMLEHLARGDIRVCWWRQKIGRHWRVMVAPVDLTYVVSLQVRSTYVLVETAYPVGSSHRERLMERAAETLPVGSEPANERQARAMPREQRLAVVKALREEGQRV